MARVRAAVEQMTWATTDVPATLPKGTVAFQGKCRIDGKNWNATIMRYTVQMQTFFDGAALCPDEMLLVHMTPEIAQRAVELATTASTT